ncbi:MAG: hypothetical protein COA58_13425 [Bacteroidetes bacterium]|nr:MAG: hypothetical protein COA58_13425 [Bacteroidota bacterium]
MNSTDYDSSCSRIDKLNCCSNSNLSIAHTASYEVITFNWLEIEIPVLHSFCKQVFSYSHSQNIQHVFIEDPPPLVLIDRSHLQVYLI